MDTAASLPDRCAAVEDPPLYRAVVVNTGGIAGRVEETETGTRVPTGAPGHPEAGANPEQFLAMAWSTCLNATVISVLERNHVDATSRVRVEVELHREPNGQYFFTPTAYVAIEGLDRDRAQRFVAMAHRRCPVSKLLAGDRGVRVLLEDY
ncbi:peroxiredoxin, Ohr subfamily [Propionibacterium cyclohexanicum]|uniref:Peroxiredoxin, Ohr subfamily n=1 Tax=Propionibacterium cyclohexanicum TaxID=64702 RepID=A0A1H9PSI0_9ACTN|nr:OsmC family protein [Propionibacterium cyclohexanicum]SER50755.1 peroxiredoxin, Ohr subfamily [Propionibacterium cyclohexanicum]